MFTMPPELYYSRSNSVRLSSSISFLVQHNLREPLVPHTTQTFSTFVTEEATFDMRIFLSLDNVFGTIVTSTCVFKSFKVHIS
ncbi:hypothetical protein ABKN59_007316 [Abortiporus biennis]